MKRTNRGNQRRSSRLASTSPARALNRSFYIESDNEDADASLIVISRPKKKRYSSQANQVLSPSKPTNDNSLSKAIVTTTTNLKCDRKPIKSSNDMNDVANQQLTSVQNFKMFRKPSFVLKKTASLESLENANVTVILTSPEAISAAIDPKQVKSESGGKKTQKLKAKKKEEQKISDFFEKSPPKMIGLDENSELDASVIAIEPDRVVLEMNSLQKPVRMVDFSEMFKMANSNITDRNDTTDRTTDFVKKTRKKRTKPTIKSKSKLQPSQESIVANKPEVLTIDNEATVISSTVIELLDIINDDDETIIYGSGVSRGELESTQSLPKPANSCIYEPDNVWTAKHAPKSIAETVCSAQLSEFIKNWILDYENKYDVNDDTSSQNSNSEVYEEEVNEDAQKELCLLISGPIGCGKTSLVYAIAKEINHKVFELNCSTRRNSKVINKLKEVTLSHTVSRKEDVGTFLEGAKSSKDMFLKNFLKGRSSITPAGSNGTTKDQPQSITKFFIQPNSKSKSEYQMGDSESLLLNGFTCESNSQSSALCLNANSM